MNQNLITVLVRFLMRFGVFILVTTPLTSLQNIHGRGYPFF